jgi:hypothetical protein
MADIKDAQKEVKVEDLLRMKRAERPDDAFWNSFDRELHQRMLQTLVKKDPWYSQLFRAASGRIAQTAAVGAAAAVLAMVMVRPVLVDSFVDSLPASNMEAFQNEKPVFAQESTSSVSESSRSAAAPMEVSMDTLDAELASDYQIEAISGVANTAGLGYTAEYAHDQIEVAAYDSTAYATDTASFASSGLATGLVY